MWRFFSILLLTVCIVLTGSGQDSFAATSRFITIGTGGVAGVYYPAGSGICRLLNRSRAEHGLRCAVASTTGSFYNLQNIASGDFDMAIVQSDWQYHAYYGTSQFEPAGPNKELRSLFSLHGEPFTVVARADSGIRDFSDLLGKRINIGNPGSGQRGTMEVVMAALGWSTDDFSEVFELDSSEQARALCQDRFDAMVFTAGHPSGSIKEASSLCATTLVNVSDPAIDTLIRDKDYYRVAVIPAGMYRGTDVDIKTFGVAATFVATTSVSEEDVYQVVKAVFENFAEFKKFHPGFAELKKEIMIADGLSAPLHPGAVRYYKEAGLL